MAAGFFLRRSAFAAVQTECSFSSVVGRKASIFVRKTLQVLLCELSTSYKNFSLVFEIFENYGIIMQVICVGNCGT